MGAPTFKLLRQAASGESQAWPTVILVCGLQKAAAIAGAIKGFAFEARGAPKVHTSNRNGVSDAAYGSGRSSEECLTIAATCQTERHLSGPNARLHRCWSRCNDTK